VLQTTAQPVWVVDADGLIRFASPAASDPHDAERGGPRHNVLEQRRLADSGFPANDEHGALSAARGTQQPVKLRALARSAPKLRQTLGSHRCAA
jgi:hypothetical protein